MRSRPCPLHLLALVVLCCLPWALPADEYTPAGADSCLACHQAGQFQVMGIFNTRHGARGDPDAPFAGLQCESCHGPSNEHVSGMMRGQKTQVQRTFGENDQASVTEQNEACLGCHQGHDGWFGSAHERSDVACVSCHVIHADSDPAFDALRQQDTCFGCHPRVRSDIHKASGHPLRFGKMACSDCHDVHDGSNDFLLAAEDVNDSCYGCHAEKRGPFLWEHAPVGEDCTLCHDAHGSNHPALLTRRPPLLCQQCHSAVGHTSAAYTGEDIGADPANRFFLARSCMNCHSHVHGSNHPSGASRTR